VREEKLLAAMTLEELSFDDTKAIGKGSYGIVNLATHLPSGIRVAVKKIDKKSLTSSRIKETLRREIQI
jgi:serine/threonine protein kinase